MKIVFITLNSEPESRFVLGGDDLLEKANHHRRIFAVGELALSHATPSVVNDCFSQSLFDYVNLISGLSLFFTISTNCPLGVLSFNIESVRIEVKYGCICFCPN